MDWTAERLTHLATGYWPAATLMAATDLGVFDALEPGGATARAVAARIACDAGRTECLLDALAALGLLSKARDGYAIAADARPLLSRGSPTCLLDALAYNGDLYRRWADLADVVRGRDAPTAPTPADPAATRRFVLGMEAKARAFAPAIADAIDLGDAATLLDVGAGPGTLSRLLLERNPRLRATLLDLSPVLAVARELCAATPVAARLAFHSADYRRDPLPGPVDVVLYAGALHQETFASAADLFGSILRTLAPGGRLLVVDLMLDAGRTAPPLSALFQLNMMLLRPGARVFAADDVVALLAHAHFVGIEQRPIAGTPYHLVAASAA